MPRPHVGAISKFLNVSAVFTIRKLVNEEEHKDLFVQDLTLMPVWMRKLITDIIDKNEHYDTLVKSHNR